MREAFTDRLRLALEKAQEEARRLNQDFVSAEHLLLGLLAVDDAEAAAGLRLAGVGLAELREKIVASLPRAGESPVVSGRLPLSPKAQRAINTALVNAQSSKSPRVSSRRLLVALLDDGGSVVRSALRGAGADLDHLQRVLAQDGAIQAEE